jgi:hypothetical protein
LGAKTCSVPAEIANRRGGDVKPFRAQERALQLEVSTITAQFACRGDDSMTRNVRPAAPPHYVANRARGAWPSRRFRHIAVGGNMSHRNSSNDRQDGPGEWRQFHSEQHPQADTALQPSGFDRQAASFDRFEIDVGAGVADHPAQSD